MSLPIRVGIGGPVGSGKTALAVSLCSKLYPKYDVAVITNDIYTKEDAEFVEHADTEPLLEECSHFLECIQTRQQPLTNAQSGIEVLKVLHACQQSIEQNGVPVSL